MPETEEQEFQPETWQYVVVVPNVGSSIEWQQKKLEDAIRAAGIEVLNIEPDTF